MNTQRVKEALEKHQIVPIRANWSRSDVGDEIMELLEELGSSTIPFYAVFPANAPDKPIVLRDFITASQVVEAIDRAVAVTGNSTAVPSAAAIELPANNGSAGPPTPDTIPVSNASVTEDKPDEKTEDKPDENPEQKPAAKTEENGDVPPAP